MHAAEVVAQLIPGSNKCVLAVTAMEAYVTEQSLAFLSAEVGHSLHLELPSAVFHQDLLSLASKVRLSMHSLHDKHAHFQLSALQEVVAILLAFASAPGTSQQALDSLQGAVWVSLPVMELSDVADSMWALSMMDAMAPESWNLSVIWYLSKQALQATGTVCTACLQSTASVIDILLNAISVD